MRPNASSAIPSRIVFVDTETVPRELRPGVLEHELRLGVADFWQRAGNKQPERSERTRFTHREEFWTWLERRCVAGKRVVVIAHNTQFDMQTLGGLQELGRRGWTLTKDVIDSERVIVRAERAGASMLWLDWFNYFRAPLEHAAELLGLEYVPLPDFTAPDEVWWRRCENDVTILRAAFAKWLGMLEAEDLGHFAPTLASQAMHAFRHRFMEHEILIGSQYAPTKLERAAYLGNRTEALTIGTLTEGPYYLVDVNSAFGAVMGHYSYPRAFRYVRRRTSRSELAKLLEEHLAIATVELATEVPIFPARHEDRLIFPVGRFTTTLTTPELLEAMRMRAVLSVGEVAVYDGAPLFRKWSLEIFALRVRYRDAGERLLEDLCKHMLQALYGKFGEHRRDWVRVADEPDFADEIWTEQDLDAGRERVYRRLGGIVKERHEEGEGYHAFPAIPAHVAAHARLLLWRYMALAGLEHVHYVDTDGLIVDDAGFRSLEPYVDPDRIGRLKLQGIANEVTIEGPKVYTFGDRSRRKGIRADAALTPEGKYRQSEILGLNAQLRAHHAGGPLERIVERAPARTGGIGRVQPTRLG